MSGMERNLSAERNRIYEWNGTQSKSRTEYSLRAEWNTIGMEYNVCTYVNSAIISDMYVYIMQNKAQTDAPAAIHRTQ